MKNDFNIQELMQLINLREKLEGKKVSKVYVSKEFIEWYKGQLTKFQEDFGLDVQKEVKVLRLKNVKIKEIDQQQQ